MVTGSRKGLGQKLRARLKTLFEGNSQTPQSWEEWGGHRIPDDTASKAAQRHLDQVITKSGLYRTNYQGAMSHLDKFRTTKGFDGVWHGLDFKIFARADGKKLERREDWEYFGTSEGEFRELMGQHIREDLLERFGSDLLLVPKELEATGVLLKRELGRYVLDRSSEQGSGPMSDSEFAKFSILVEKAVKDGTGPALAEAVFKGSADLIQKGFDRTQHSASLPPDSQDDECKLGRGVSVSLPFSGIAPGDRKASHKCEEGAGRREDTVWKLPNPQGPRGLG